MNRRPTPDTDALARGNHVVPTAFAEDLERERSELRSDLEFRRGLFQLQEEQLNGVRAELDRVREENNQYKGLLIRLYNDLFVHHKGEAVRDFKALFREENYN